MAEQNSVPSDLFKHVYSFLLDNKFSKAAQQFMKQAKVVSAILTRVQVPHFQLTTFYIGGLVSSYDVHAVFRWEHVLVTNQFLNSNGASLQIIDN